MSAPTNLHGPRLLITGGTGFIGAHLAQSAHRLGMDVRVTGRVTSELENERRNELLAAGVTFEPGDLRDPDVSHRLVQGREAIVHLAAAQHEAHMSDAYFRSVNVDATRLLLESARSRGVRRFVYGSTIGVYGGAARGPLDEDSPARPDNVYGRTKLAAEALVRAQADDLEICIARISETYGPGDRRLLKLFRAIDRGQFALLGDGENRRRPIHVADLARGLLLAARHPAANGATFIFAGSQTVTTRELVAAVAAALHCDAPRLRLPLWPFIAAARAMQAMARPLGVRVPLHPRRLDFFRASFDLDTAKAQTLLDFRAEIDLRAGLADAVRWYRTRGLLPAHVPHQLAPTKSSG